MATDLSIQIDPHPLLRAGVFTTEFPLPLRETCSPAGLAAFLQLDSEAPIGRDEGVRSAVRDMLRHGGYKPTGRGKPASEYLVRAAMEGALASINPAVDACNAVSLHSGLPISVIDLDRARPPFRIGLGSAGDRYIFNASGQEIDVSGLLCLFDAEGPCANAVRDSQRTKTGPETLQTLTVVWGVAGHESRLAAAIGWYRELLADLGSSTML